MINLHWRIQRCPSPLAVLLYHIRHPTSFKFLGARAAVAASSPPASFKFFQIRSIKLTGR